MADQELVAQLDVLGRDECLALLASAPVGRLGLVLDGRPEILPVNFALDGDHIVFRTGQTTVLTHAALQSVAFEVDDVDPATQSGWSVVVHGVARDIGDAIDPTSERLRQLGLVTWAPGERQRWFHVIPSEITGRRVRTTPVGGSQ